MSLSHIADVTIIVVILASVIIGLLRGFVKEALSLCTWVVAIWLGVVLHDLMSAEFTGYIQNDTVRSLAAFGSVFITVLVLGSLLTYGIAMLVKRSGISGTDRVLGLVFGMTRGIFLVALVLTVLNYTAFRHSTWWQQSLAVTKFQPLVAWVNEMVPERLHFIKDNLMTDKPHKKESSQELASATMSLDALAEVNLLEEDE